VTQIQLGGSFRIGEFVVQPAQGRIEGPAGETRLQPKIIDVLLCLAAAPGEVVSRQAIHEAVWGNIVVTDDALNRCISELRQAMPGPAKYIETVPKRGYRLVAPVEPIAENDAARVTDAPAVPRLPQWDPAVATVAVLPFECITPGLPHAFVAEGLPMAVHASLAALDRVRVASRRAYLALDAMDAASKEAEAKSPDAQYTISGNVAEANGRLRVIVEVDDVDGGVLLWSKRFEVDTHDVLAFERQLTEAVVGAFGGVRLRAEIDRTRLSQASSLTTWELVQRARAYLVKYRSGALREGRELLAEAARKDPDYAIAHAMHGLVVAEHALNALSVDANSDRKEALEAVRRALALAPSDPAVLRCAGCAQTYCGDYAAGARTLRRALQLAPNDFGSWGYLCWPLSCSGRAEDLVELKSICDRLLDLAPSHPGAPYWHYHRAVAFAIAADYEAALAPIEACLASQPEFLLGLMHHANVLGLLGRDEDAAAAADRARAANEAMTVDRYVEIVEHLSDQPEVVARRTAGLPRRTGPSRPPRNARGSSPPRR
jgi:adenylate cyclase